MATKWCSKFEVAQKRDPIVFQGHLSNYKVSHGKKMPHFTQIEHFRTEFQIEFTDGFEIMDKAWHSIKGGALLFF